MSRVVDLEFDCIKGDEGGITDIKDRISQNGRRGLTRLVKFQA